MNTVFGCVCFLLPLRRPCTTGFIFGYLYGGKNCTRKIEWWSFMSKRLAGLYPLYLASIIAGECPQATLWRCSFALLTFATFRYPSMQASWCSTRCSRTPWRSS